MEFHLIDRLHFTAKEESLLDEFGRTIFVQAFPDPDEREPFENIKTRVRGVQNSNEPATIGMIATEGGNVVGGIVYDWYDNCKSLEIIYVAVDSKFRRNGLGRALTLDCTRTVVDLCSDGGKDKVRVYFETENPFAVQDEGSSPINPVGRLRFFEGCGALRIPIPYVQPPLDPSKGWASNMFLMVLPQFSGNEESIPSDEICQFLKAFYDGLGAADEPELQTLLDSVNEVSESNGDVLLDRLSEHSYFQIYRASVVAHYIPKEDGALTLHPDATCPVFNSYESDLMNYRHQKKENRPFSTHHHSLIEDVCITFPPFYSYTSEGHSFYRITGRTTVKADISVNYSFSKASDKVIAHVVLSPSEGSFFTEMDLIKIITLFGSNQEEPEFLGDISITVGEEKFNGFSDLLNHVLGSGTFSGTHTGISEIELSGAKDSEGRILFNNFSEFRDQVLSGEGPEESDWNKALCGIILGIFDFERMNSPEIFDTVQPIVERGNTFQVLCRGHLCKLCYESDDQYERVENILISPYILIPSVALAYNEYVMQKNASAIKQMESGSDSDSSFHRMISWTISEKIFHFDKALDRTKESLSTEYLKEIFQYPSEQEILEYGQKQRGLDSMHSDLENLISLKENQLEDMKSKYAGSIDTIQNILLMILAIMQVYTAVNAYEEAFFTISGITLIIGLLILIRKRRL